MISPVLNLHCYTICTGTLYTYMCRMHRTRNEKTMTTLNLTESSPISESAIESGRASSQVWLDVLSRVYGYRPVHLLAHDAGGQVTGYLPLCLIQSALTGRRLVSLPFADYCPLLAVDKASASDLLDQAIALARSQRV